MAGNIWIGETFINQDEGYRFGDTDPYETWTDDKGRLFRELQKEYGKCMSKVYIDTDKGAKAIGWVFQKRMQYEDAKKYYTREVWVTLHSGPPEKSVHCHYLES